MAQLLRTNLNQSGKFDVRRMRVAIAAAVSLALALTAAGTLAIAAPEGEGTDPPDPTKGERGREFKREIGDQVLNHAPEKSPGYAESMIEAAARARQKFVDPDDPTSKRERRLTRTAYRAQSSSEALSTALDAYPELLKKPAWHALSVAPGAEVKRYLSANAAVVDVPDQSQDSVIESTYPIRGDGASNPPVDLRLVDAGDHFRPHTPSSQVRIDKSAPAGVSMPEIGLTVQPEQIDGNPQQRRSGDTVFWANAYGESADADLLARPVPGGVEHLIELRSDRSPEQYAFTLQLPPGSKITRATGEAAGARITRDGDEVGRMHEPIAADAAGRWLPVSWSLEGNRLEVEVEHQGEDVAYPLMLDPTFTDSNSSEFFRHSPYWNREWSGADVESWTANNYAYAAGYAWRYFDTWEGAWWRYDPPGLETSIYAVATGNVYFFPGYHATTLAQGIYSRQTGWWEPNAYSVNSGGIWAGGYVHCRNPGCSPGGTTRDNQFYFHAYHSGPYEPRYPLEAGSVYTFHSAFGGATVAMSEDVPPEHRIVSHYTNGNAGSPGGWIANADLKVISEARDQGVGLRLFHLSIPGDTYNFDGQSVPIESRRKTRMNCNDGWSNYCPSQSWTRSDTWPVADSFPPLQGDVFAYRTNDMAEGANSVSAWAVDQVGNASPKSTWQIKVDRTAPIIAVNGGLGPSPQPGDDPNAFGLRVTDGSASPAAAQRSGVEYVSVKVNGKEIARGSDDLTGLPWTADCPADPGSCSFPDGTGFKTYRPFEAGEEGYLNFEINARDAVGHTESRSWQAKNDAAPPEVTAPDALEGPQSWTRSAAYQVAGAAARDSGLGVKALELEVPTAGGATTQRREHDCQGTFESQCPKEWALPSEVPELPDFEPFASADLAEGISAANLSALDAVDKRSEPREYRTYIDRTRPTIEWSGGLVDGDGYDLSVTASDGSAESAAQSEWPKAGSGVERLRILANGNHVYDSDEQPCEREWGSCSQSAQVELDPLEYGEGPVTVLAIATDHVGHVTERETTQTIEFDGPKIVRFESSNLHGWVGERDAETAITAANPGRGVERFELNLPGGGKLSEQVDCGATGGDCPSYTGRTFEYSTASLPEGVHDLVAQAFSPSGRSSDPRDQEVSIDHTAPAIDVEAFEGSRLYSERDALATPQQYPLAISAQDPAGAPEPDERAGVDEIEVLVDGERSARWSERCETGGCSMERSFVFDTLHYGTGEHTVTAIVRDQAGNETTQSFTVNVASVGEPSLGSSRLGLEQWFHYDSSETGLSGAHVNLATGNLAWHKVPLVNSGRGLSSFLNLTYNSFDHPAADVPAQSDSRFDAAEYDEAGLGFSVGLSGITRLNEPLRLLDEEGAEMRVIDADGSVHAPASVVLTDPDGTTHTFQARGDKPFSFHAPDGVNMHLRKYSSLVTDIGKLPEQIPDFWAMTRPDGATYFFDGWGFLRSIEDRNDNKLTYEYELVTVATGEPCLVAVVVPGVCEPRLAHLVDPAGSDSGAGASLRERRSVKLRYFAYSSGTHRAGRLREVEDHGGRILRLDYAALGGGGYLSSIVEAAGTVDARETKLEYAPADAPRHPQLDGIRDPRGAWTRFGYHADELADARERRAAWVENRRGKRRDYGYEGDLRSPAEPTSAEVTDARGNSTRVEVDLRDRPVTITDPLETKAALAWDADNNVIAHAAAAESADQALTRYSYNDHGLLTAKVDPLGRVTHLAYVRSAGLHCSQNPGQDAGETPVSDLVSITRPAGNSWTFDYEAKSDPACDSPSTDGNVTAETDPLGASKLMTYDAHGQLVTQRDESGDLTSFASHDANGLPQEVFAPRANETGESAAEHRSLYRYDELGNLRQRIDPRGATDLPGGPLSGEISAQRGAPYTTTLRYDSHDRLVEEHRPRCSDAENGCDPVSFATRAYGYDASDNLTTKLDGEGAEWRYSHTPMDRIAEERAPPTPDQPDGQRTTYSYDAEEGLVEVVSPRGNETAAAGDYSTSLELDAIGRRVVTIRRGGDSDPRTEDDPLITSYAYDVRDNVTGVVYPNQNPATDDPAAIAQAVGNATDKTRQRFALEYDLADNLISEVENPNPNGACGQANDAPKRTDYRYDPNGNQIWELGPRGYCGLDDPAEQITFNDFDERDQLVATTDALGNTTRYDYTVDGLLAAKTSPRGTATETDGDFTTRYRYNANDELIARSVPWAQGERGLSNAALDAIEVSYQRDPVGDPIAITDARGNSFTNTFYDGGELKTTERPSWWQLDWQSGQHETPDAGLRFGRAASGADPDLAAPIGGPSLSEAASGGAGDGGSAIGPENAPASVAPSDFGEVDPEALPDFLPRAGQTELRYDAEMRLKAVAGADGVARRIDYDPAGRIAAKRWPFHGLDEGEEEIVHAYSWDANDNVTEFTDGEDHTTRFAYDEFDRRIEEVAPGSSSSPGAAIASETTQLRYDRNSNLIRRVTPRAGLTFRFDHDSLDRLVFEANPANESWSYEYDAAGNRTAELSPRGIRTETAFDPLDRPAELTEAVGTGVERATTLGYDRDGNRTSLVEPGAENAAERHVERHTRRVFDGRGLPWKVTVGAGSSVARTTILEHDAEGNTRRIVNPKGVAGGVPQVSDSGGTGQEASDAAVHATVGEYDEHGLLQTLHLPHSSQPPSAERLGPDGRSAAEEEADSADPHGIDQAAENAKRFRKDFGYDQRGRLAKASDTYRSTQDPATVETVTYDHFDTDWVKRATEPARSVSDLDPDSDVDAELPARILRYGYDERGNQDFWRTAGFVPNSPDARKVTRDFYPSGLLAKRTGFKPTSEEDDGPSRRTYSYFYNRNRSLVATEDTLPDLSQPIREAIPNYAPTRTTTIERDAAERELRVSEDWTSGRDTAFAYDPDGNVTERRTELGGAGPTKTTDFTYDPLGRETRMRAWEGDFATAEQGGEVRATHTAYHPSGDVFTRSRSDGAEEVVRWRADGMMDRLQRGPGIAPGDDVPAGGKDISYTYDLNANLTRDERGHHAYNARDQLVLWKRAHGQPKPATFVSYRLDGDGAMKEKREPKPEGSGTLTTTFHQLGERLVRAANEDVTSTYRYDELGNAVEIHSTPHGGVLPDPAEAPPENPSCETSGWDDPSVTYYCYDEFSRQVASKGPHGEDEEQKPETYLYDGLDRRDFRVTREDAGPKVREHSYVGTSEQLAREQRPAESGAGTEIATYDYDSTGARQGQVLDSGTTEATYRSYRTDAQGSVEALEQEDGAVKSEDRYRYDPYGELQDPNPDDDQDAEAELSDDAQANPFRFQGHYYDSAVRSYDMQARSYRPEHGQFLSEDRYEAVGADIGLEVDPLTQNRYAFAGGNPVSRIEFDGHKAYCPYKSKRRVSSCIATVGKAKGATPGQIQSAIADVTSAGAATAARMHTAGSASSGESDADEGSSGSGITFDSIFQALTWPPADSGQIDLSEAGEGAGMAVRDTAVGAWESVRSSAECMVSGGLRGPQQVAVGCAIEQGAAMVESVKALPNICDGLTPSNCAAYVPITIAAAFLTKRGPVGRGGGSGGAVVPKAPASLGRWGESRLAQVLGGAGSKPRSPLTTAAGQRRYPDRLVNGVAHEAKAGLNVGLTSTIRRQIDADAALIRGSQLRGAHWHFFRGASDDVLGHLKSRGIPYTVHP